MGLLDSFYNGKRVVLTGHTGFKGSWMAEWLLMMGADVTGISLDPKDDPALFDQLALSPRLHHHIQDIRDAAAFATCINKAQPDVVFHLAAQPLVRYSYEEPLETFETNVLGTANLLNALRSLDKSCQVVVVTTDKCYENREIERPYTEEDPMGGYDPYSASKGAAELVVSSYRRSYFHPAQYGDSHQIALSSARAGNVIGGGDWAADRIVPDCMRMLDRGDEILVRNPFATRPWQHVLEPLGGYLLLPIRMEQAASLEARSDLFSGFNFGPLPEANRSVRELVEEVLVSWPGRWKDGSDPTAPHEAGLLSLSVEKAERVLGWRPQWDFKTAVKRTVEWYHAVMKDPARARECTVRDIEAYLEEFGRDL